MRLTSPFSFLLILLAIGTVSAQSKDDEESVDVSRHGNVEGSGNAPSDDEDTVEGSGLPPSQVYTKLTTIVHARPAVAVKPTTSAPEIPPKKKDPLPAIINMDLVEKEQREKQKEKVQAISIAPAIPRITTNRPDEASPMSNYILGAVLGGIILLIVVVIIIIVVCRNKHKSDYTPGRPE